MDEGFYPEVKLGGIFIRSSSTVFGSTIVATSTNFDLGLGLGYKVNDNVDISARYEMIFFSGLTSGYLGARIGYIFN